MIKCLNINLNPFQGNNFLSYHGDIVVFGVCDNVLINDLENNESNIIDKVFFRRKSMKFDFGFHFLALYLVEDKILHYGGECLRVIGNSLGACLDHVWIMSGSYLDHVWIMSGSCLDHVWIISRSCLDQVWIMSDSCLDYVWIMSG